jgi:hypothetical protein
MAEVSKRYAVNKPYLTASLPAVTSQIGERISRLCDIRGNAAFDRQSKPTDSQSLPSQPLLDPVGVRSRREAEILMAGASRLLRHQSEAFAWHVQPGANAYPRAWIPGRKRRAANTPSTMNTSRTIPCAMANGGSDPVGARSCKNGTFRKPWATSTNTLR